MKEFDRYYKNFPHKDIYEVYSSYIHVRIILVMFEYETISLLKDNCTTEFGLRPGFWYVFVDGNASSGPAWMGITTPPISSAQQLCFPV